MLQIWIKKACISKGFWTQYVHLTTKIAKDGVPTLLLLLLLSIWVFNKEFPTAI